MIEAWDDELKRKAEAVQPRFCQQCGAARPEDARFCPSCGRPYEPAFAGPTQASNLMPTTPAALPTPPSGLANRTDLAALMAGLAWIVVALVDGYLAYLQWTFAPYAGVSESSLQGFAAVNAIVAGVTLVFGALLLVGPTRGRLTASIVWGILSVVGGVLQMAGGATHWTIFVGTAGAAVAAVLAWVARSNGPATS